MPIRTLMVEDSVDARNIMRRRLEEIGCEVVGETDSGAEALKLLSGLHPQLVTLDLILPQTDGIETMTLFRSIRSEFPDVSVAVISAQPSRMERAAYIGGGAIAYIQKPFADLRLLQEKLQKLFLQE
jgi:two-component system, chemotaxis family, chemotaxis protein CheY